MKAILITGGCGFIGSNFIRLFLKSHPDWKILNLDALTYAGNLENTQDYQDNPHYQFVQGNICNEKLVDSLTAKVQAVINFAAESHVDRSFENPSDFLEANVMGFKTLIQGAMKHQIKKFLHISTDEVYGSLETGSADENAALCPNSPYSASKASADLLARAYEKTFSYPIMITRSCNNFGPYQYPEKVIPLFITNLMNKKKVPLYGSGENRREWIHVEDNCAALTLVFDQGKPGEIYNIGSAHELSNNELTHHILETMGASDQMIEYVKDRPGHDLRYALNSKKIKQLGFKPRFEFLSALRSTVDWYKQHQDWWLPLKNNKFTVK